MKTFKIICALVFGLCLVTQAALAKEKKSSKKAKQAQTNAQADKKENQEPTKSEGTEETPIVPPADTEAKAETEPSGGGGW